MSQGQQHRGTGLPHHLASRCGPPSLLYVREGAQVLVGIRLGWGRGDVPFWSRGHLLTHLPRRNLLAPGASWESVLAL